MKNKILKYSLIALIALNTTSCDDNYLNRLPLDSPSSETFLKNEEELEMAVTGVYNSLYATPAATPMPFALTFDYVSDIAWERNTNALQALGAGLADANNQFTSDFWNQFYVGINRCNFILAKSEQLSGIVTDEKLALRIAEVRFVRAYFYFYLNELFGGVPLLTTVVPLSESQIPKSTKSEIAEFIVKELDEIANILPISTQGNDIGRVTRGTALALKSRTALFNKMWEKSIEASKAIMDMNHYELNNNFEQLFSYNGENSKEIIWASQYKRGVKTHGTPSQFYSRLKQGFSNKIPVQSLVDSYECIDGLSIDKSPLYQPNSPFLNRDPRLTQSIVLPQSEFLGVIFETHPDSLQTWDYTSSTPTRVANIDATNAFASFSGYLWRKYADIKDMPDRSNSELNPILFRYAEVLLNYAEAKIELNQLDNSVYSAINTVRQRPSVNMPIIASGKSQQALRSIIRKERKYELAGEGLRLFDIRRWEIAHEVMNGPLLGRIRESWLSNAPTIDENGTPNYNNVTNRSQMRIIENRLFDSKRDYVWPIPRIETEVNKSLIQNNNY